MGNTILLADKSTTIQKIVQLTFADDNFNIHSASDGQAALDMIPQIRPDLVLADISLPLKSGYDICSTLRNDQQFADFSDTPVILLAGIYETMDEERSRQVEDRVRQVGANDFLSKPFDPQLLISKVKQYLSAGGKAPQTASSPVCAQEPDSGIHLFDTESSEKPPEDMEKTMMLPGGPFGSMFASEPAPYEEEPRDSSDRRPIDVEAAKPVNEVVFDEENFSPVDLGSDEEDLSQATLKIERKEDGRFAGREEKEFDYNTDASPASAPDLPGSIPLILPNAEDPFGDVFPESQGAAWNSSSLTDEDSPFGVPEAPPVPDVVAEAQPEVHEPSALFSEPDHEQATPVQVETFEDTWPGMPVRPNMAPQVEELFESDSPIVPFSEDAEELEADLADATSDPETERPVSTEPQVVSQSLAKAELSDEIIDKIADRVLNKLSERVVSEIVWQVVPDLAEKMIRRELEKLHASEE